MNHLSKIALATLVALSAAGAAAQESVDLSVTGTVVPSSCIPTLSTASLDWGTLSIDGSSDIILPAKRFVVEVNCEHQTRLALEISDNKTGDLPDVFPFKNARFAYRSFDLADGKAVGGYKFVPTGYTAITDGGEAKILTSPDNGTTWNRIHGGQGVSGLPTNTPVAFGNLGAGGKYFPEPHTYVHIQVDVDGIIRPVDLPQTADFQISGSSTFTIKYL